MFFVCFDELLSQRSPLLVLALIEYVTPRLYAIASRFLFLPTY